MDLSVDQFRALLFHSMPRIQIKFLLIRKLAWIQ